MISLTDNLYITLKNGKILGGSSQTFTKEIELKDGSSYSIHIDKPYNDITETDENNNSYEFTINNGTLQSSNINNINNMYSTRTVISSNFFTNIFNTKNNTNSNYTNNDNKILNRLRHKKNIY